MSSDPNMARASAPLLSLAIRPNTPTDVVSLRSLIDAVAREGLWLVTDTYVPTTQWEHVLSQPADSSNHLLLVAELENEIIGWCRIFPLFGSKSPHVADVGIGVAKAWRDRGIGTALMYAAFAWAKTQGFEKLILAVFANNARALHVFHKVGFAQTGVRYKQFFVQGEYLDEVLMEKFLAD